MSAPLVVNTADGTVWLRRASTRGGLALYAPADVCACPEFVMATEAELAEHGIAGSADVLPMPVGVEPSEAERLRLRVDEVERKYTFDTAELKRERDTLRARVAELEAETYVAPSPSCTRCYGADAARFVAKGGATSPCRVCGPSEVERLRARVAELESERHVTNEALDDAVQALRADRGRPSGADGITRRIAPTQAHAEGVEDVSPQVRRLRGLLAGQRAAVEDPHDGPLAHKYLVGRDLPETGGAR